MIWFFVDKIKFDLNLIWQRNFTYLTIIHLLVKNVPNNFLGRSHSPVLCSLFHKRKSVVPFKDSKNSNLISTFSLLHHFWLCPLLSSNMSLCMFWLSRRSWTMILQRIFEMRKEKLLSCQSHFQIVLSQQLLWQSYRFPALSTLFSMTSFYRYY